jgi:hypothetical protein
MSDRVLGVSAVLAVREKGKVSWPKEKGVSPKPKGESYLRSFRVSIKLKLFIS